MHIKTGNTEGEYQSIITLFGLTGGKDMGSSIGLVSSCLPSTWIVFTRALTVADFKNFFCWRFD